MLSAAGCAWAPQTNQHTSGRTNDAGASVLLFEKPIQAELLHLPAAVVVVAAGVVAPM